MLESKRNCNWHNCINKMNTNSISIEMCCYKTNKGQLDIKEDVVNKAIELTIELMKKYNIDVDHVIRHYDATRKVCPAPFVNDESRWENFKKALGDKFTSSTTSDSSEKVIATVKVTADAGLNCREKATTSSNIIKAYTKIQLAEKNDSNKIIDFTKSLILQINLKEEDTANEYVDKLLKELK